MDEKEDINKVHPPNPPPAGDKENPPLHPSPEGNKSEIRSPIQSGTKSEIGKERDYNRAVYQNLMVVVELLDRKFPVPVSHRQLQEELGLSKGVIFDVAWNLCKRGWAENVEGGTIRRRYTRMHKEVLLGRAIKNLIENMFGVVIGDNEDC